jgi:hypothetical protein
LKDAEERQTLNQQVCGGHGRISAWKNCDSEEQFCMKQPQEEESCPQIAELCEGKKKEECGDEVRKAECNKYTFVPAPGGPSSKCKRCSYNKPKPAKGGWHKLKFWKNKEEPKCVANPDVDAECEQLDACLCNFGFSGLSCERQCGGKGELVPWETWLVERRIQKKDKLKSTPKDIKAALLGTPNGQVCDCKAPKDRLEPGIDFLLGKKGWFSGGLGDKISKKGHSSKYDNLRLTSCKSDQCQDDDQGC